ncbi:ArsR/SmtB family transcription factor [Nitratireductor basaltis]|uniref:ArsR/SmtB family transcription factor n=1 Tax=Nitratireductor basaltis TaxID=472175 RepID=UPI00056796D5|nr:metalloregulator ArsR/SmtB family transcription factor [Nitratireductor basaltis]
MNGHVTPNPKQDQVLARRFAAMAHPARLAILQQLAAQDACCCKDVVGRVGLAQSTVSQHLKILQEAGLVDYRQERPRSRYTINRRVLDETRARMNHFLDDCCTRQVPAGHE